MSLPLLHRELQRLMVSINSWFIWISTFVSFFQLMRKACIMFVCGVLLLLFPRNHWTPLWVVLAHDSPKGNRSESIHFLLLWLVRSPICFLTQVINYFVFLARPLHVVYLLLFSGRKLLCLLCVETKAKGGKKHLYMTGPNNPWNSVDFKLVTQKFPFAG